VGEHEENFKDNSEQELASFPTDVSPVRKEASFEQLLGQLDIQGSRRAAQIGVTGLFSLVSRNSGHDASAPSRPAEKQESAALALPDSNLSKRPGSEPPSSTIQADSSTSKSQEPHSKAQGDFTRIFTKLPKPQTARPAILSKLPANSATSSLASDEGSFTQIFQRVEPARSPVQSAVSSTAEPLGKEPLAAESAPMPNEAFSGSIHSQPESGGFTELLNALGSHRAASAGSQSLDAAFTPSRPSAALHAGGPDENRAFMGLSSSQSSSAFAPPVSAETVPGPGEFTQLLQILQRPPQNISPASIASSPTQTESSSADSNLSSAAPSDFTRVMKSAAARSNIAAAPSPVSTQQQNRDAAGLPVGVPPTLPLLTPTALAMASIRTVLRKFAPGLLVMNGVLLAVLILLVSLLLLRKHH
jgi:hypothetical protein